MAPKGKALLVGLNSVDPNCYGGWNGQNGCWGCELDVDNIENILTPLNYDIDILKTEDARAEAILEGLNTAASTLVSGDIFVFYFSGHGGQQPDTDGDEMDGQDETLITYNRPLVDDELNEVWLKFKAGVRIFMISDSCNSGTNYKNLKKPFFTPTTISLIPNFEIALKMKAKLIHFGGCRDGFGSSGFMQGGAFTMALCDVWASGDFQGNYPDFHQAICARISTSQQPQYSQYGSGITSFRNQKPFSISSLIHISPMYYEYEIWLPFDPPPWLSQFSQIFNPAIQNSIPGSLDRSVSGQKVIVRLKTGQ